MSDSIEMNSKSTIVSLVPDELETPPLSLGQLTWRRFRRHHMAIFGSVVILIMLIFAFGGMIFVTEADANRTETGTRLQPPSREHPFGTDTIGRDIFAAYDLWGTDFAHHRFNRHDG